MKTTTTHARAARGVRKDFEHRPYAFISYATEDQDIALWLQRALELNGVNVWLDRGQIQVGENLKTTIGSAIKAATWVIPIISQRTMRSHWVYSEVELSSESLLPVVVDDEDGPEPSQLVGMSWFHQKISSSRFAVIGRHCREAEQIDGLLRAIHERWPDHLPNGPGARPENGHLKKNGKEAAEGLRHALWATLPELFYRLEDRFSDLCLDESMAVWVVVGLDNPARSALMHWLQDRCANATRIDVDHSRFGALQERLEHIRVHVRMFDSITSDSSMHAALTAVEDHLNHVERRPAPRGLAQLCIVACTPRQVKLVVDRLGRARIRYALDHMRGMSCEDAVRLIDHFDAFFRPMVGDEASDLSKVRERLKNALRRSWVPAAVAKSGDGPQQRRFFTTSLSAARYSLLRKIRESEEVTGKKTRLKRTSKLGLPYLRSWEVDYAQHTVRGNLAQEQWEDVRNVVRFGPSWTPSVECRERLDLLAECSLVSRRGQRYCVSDRTLAKYFVPPIVIHHLSDFHLSAEDPRLSRALERYLEEVLRDPERCPHLVVVSGDLFGDVYKLTMREGDDVVPNPLRPWFQELLASTSSRRHILLNDEAPRLMVVGGNQDVDALQLSEHHPDTAWIAAARRSSLTHLLDMKGVVHPYKHAPEGPAHPAAIVKFGPLTMALLDSCAYGTGSVDNHDPLFHVIRQATRHLYGEPHERTRSPSTPRAGPEVPSDALAALKVSLPAGRDERNLTALANAVTAIEPGLVSDKTLDAVQRLPGRELEEVRMSALHHPLSWAPGDHVAEVGQLRNAGQVRKVLAETEVGLVMHGHLHMHWFDELRSPLNTDWTLRTVAAASMGGHHDDDALGFNEIRVRWEDRDAYVLVRPFARQGGAWRPGDAYEFRPGSPMGRRVSAS